MLEVEQELDDGVKGQAKEEVWVEFIEDLWEKNLSKWRNVFHVQGRGPYGFQEKDEKEEASIGEWLMSPPPLREAVEEEERRVRKNKLEEMERRERKASSGFEASGLPEDCE